MTVSPQSPPTPFVEFGRQAWSRLAATTPLPLTSDDVALLRGLGDPTDLTEVDDVYRPLSALLQLYAGATGSLHEATSSFLGERPRRTPYVIGIAGSVAVGKSSTARLMRELMRRWPQTPRVDLVTTDGFLYPNDELERRGLLQRKGFPESYDRRALLRFVAEVKGGSEEVTAPLYDHITYDIVPERRQVVRQPDVLIIEGLNVLQPARITANGTTSIAVSDFFDFSIYVDARRRDIKSWYVERFLKLRSTAFSEPGSYFRHFAELDDAAAVARAEQIWTSINERNLQENIEPTRGRATLVVTKDAEHRMHRMRLRKL